MKKLPVSEYFYSIQGEGPTAGTPAVFIRLTGCNLHCGIDKQILKSGKKLKSGQQDFFEQHRKPDATWVCDTIAVWMKGESIRFDKLVKEMNKEISFINNLSKGAHLVFTGGEPLLHQKLIEEFQSFLRSEYSIKPYIEIETNCTIKPSAVFWNVDQWNVSPKLVSSGHNSSYNESAIRYFAQKDSKYGESANFKFVISEYNDWREVRQIIEQYNIKKEMVYLMPAASNRGQLERRSKLVAEIAKSEGVKYTSRLQLEIWNKAVGV